MAVATKAVLIKKDSKVKTRAAAVKPVNKKVAEEALPENSKKDVVKIKKIAVLTSGGDAPGMNAAIRAVVRCGIAAGYSMVGIKRGYQGMIEGDFVGLDMRSVGNTIQLGGTILKTSRSVEFVEKEGFDRAVANLKKNKIDAVIVIGGDGSIRGAQELQRAGIHVAVLPGTIDNDLPFTDYTIGFDTAVNTIVSLINNVRDTSGSHDRISVIEVMGGKCGDIALASGLAAGAEFILVPEVEFSLKEITDKLIVSQRKGKESSIIVVNEKVAKASELALQIQKVVGSNVISLVVGHIQRGGSPSRYDRDFASRAGAKAIEVFLSGESGKAIGIRENSIVALPLEDALIPRDHFDYFKYDLARLLAN